MLLNIGKTTPGAKNDSLVMNTLGNLDSPVMNSQFIMVYEDQASKQVYKNTF
jgi:hypothetical protein